MKTRVLILLAALFGAPAIAQNLLPVKGYLHLEGKIDNDLLVTMDLVKDRDSLYSTLSIRSENYSSRNYNIWYSDPKELCGNINASGTLWLKEVFSEYAPLINGQLTGNGMIKGTWNSDGGKRKLPLELVEKYPEGSVQFNVYSLKGSKALTKKPNGQKGEISLLLLLPEESSNPVISDSLRLLMIEKFTGKRMNPESPERMLEQIRDSYFESYFTSNEPLLKEFPDAPSLNWELLKYMHIMNNSRHRLTFSVLTYAFTGGAHGLETEEFHNLDLKTGKMTGLEDLLKPGYDAALTQLLTRKLHELYQIPENQKLTDAGYFTDTVKPTSNFYLTENGIGFYYNHYDIAPYSFGPSDVFLTFDEVRGLMK